MPLRILLVAIMCVCASHAHAAVISLQGVVEDPGLLGGSPWFNVNVGDSFTLTLDYDHTQADSNPSATSGQYYLYDPILDLRTGAIVVSAGSTEWRTDFPGGFSVLALDNGPGADSLSTGGEGAVHYIGLSMIDSTGTALMSDAALLTIDPSRWDSGAVSIGSGFPDSRSFRGSIVGTRSYPIPEPATLGLLALGVGVLASFARSRF